MNKLDRLHETYLIADIANSLRRNVTLSPSVAELTARHILAALDEATDGYLRGVDLAAKVLTHDLTLSREGARAVALLLMHDIDSAFRERIRIRRDEPLRS